MLETEDERVERIQADLIDLLADLTMRQAVWQHMMTDRLREIAALRAINDRLRDELRRYTRARVV
jgi:hypothetical protein